MAPAPFRVKKRRGPFVKRLILESNVTLPARQSSICQHENPRNRSRLGLSPKLLSAPDTVACIGQSLEALPRNFSPARFTPAIGSLVDAGQGGIDLLDELLLVLHQPNGEFLFKSAVGEVGGMDRDVGQVAARLAAGLGLALEAAGFVRSVLFGLQPFDPATYAGVTILMGVAAAAACAWPAYRASRIDPLNALREL